LKSVFRDFRLAIATTGVGGGNYPNAGSPFVIIFKKVLTFSRYGDKSDRSEGRNPYVDDAKR
jgi:hypothetical protein